MSAPKRPRPRSSQPTQRPDEGRTHAPHTDPQPAHPVTDQDGCSCVTRRCRGSLACRLSDGRWFCSSCMPCASGAHGCSCLTSWCGGLNCQISPRQAPHGVTQRTHQPRTLTHATQQRSLEPGTQMWDSDEEYDSRAPPVRRPSTPMADAASLQTAARAAPNPQRESSASDHIGFTTDAAYAAAAGGTSSQQPRSKTAVASGTAVSSTASTHSMPRATPRIATGGKAPTRPARITAPSSPSPQRESSAGVHIGFTADAAYAAAAGSTSSQHPRSQTAVASGTAVSSTTNTHSMPKATPRIATGGKAPTRTARITAPASPSPQRESSAGDHIGFTAEAAHAAAARSTSPQPPRSRQAVTPVAAAAPASPYVPQQPRDSAISRTKPAKRHIKVSKPAATAPPPAAPAPAATHTAAKSSAPTGTALKPAVSFATHDTVIAQKSAEASRPHAH